MEPEPKEAIETVVREEWGRALATLVGYVDDIDAAEDMLQEAVLAALQHWPGRGVPRNPRAWLLQTARRKAIDGFRRDANFAAKAIELRGLMELDLSLEQNDLDQHIHDERLRLIFTCCHPALSEQASVALTLRTLGGLSTTEIARAFLTPDATMAQRLVRAKKKIKSANIPYRVPPPELWPERLAAVLAVVYLIFNEGYSASSGAELMRVDLCQEAIRLGEIVMTLIPGEPEVQGLVALMLLHDSRRDGRVDSDGNLITLEDQDRTRWNTSKIKRGQRMVGATSNLGRPGGPYQIQAAISATHTGARTWSDTDWEKIADLYDDLYRFEPTPVVKLNWAIARSFAGGPEDGLRVLEELEGSNGMGDYQPYHAAKADLLRRAGRASESMESYTRALSLARNASERRFLEKRLAELG